MSATVRASRAKGSVTIHVTGRFDFSCHQEFRRAYEGQNEVEEFLVDLSETEYIDSSALGMLLLLRERADGQRKVKIVNCRPAVRRILEVANFQTLFPIE